MSLISEILDVFAASWWALRPLSEVLIQVYGLLDLAKFYIKVENKDPIYKKLIWGHP